MNRDHKSSTYKQWVSEVKKRDDYQCRWPGCKRRKKLQVHHIKKWTTNPFLRYVISNGICLCQKHHSIVTGKEEQFEAFLQAVLLSSLMRIIRRI